jgi:hypothetical protein
MTISLSEYVLLAAQSYFYYRKKLGESSDGASPFDPTSAGLPDWTIETRFSGTLLGTGFSATKLR